MAKRRKSTIPGLSFSWKRASGLTKARQNFARKTGISTTKAGMQRKVGKAVMGGGCLLNVLGLIILLSAIVFLIALIA